MAFNMPGDFFVILAGMISNVEHEKLYIRILEFLSLDCSCVVSSNIGSHNLRKMVKISNDDWNYKVLISNTEVFDIWQWQQILTECSRICYFCIYQYPLWTSVHFTYNIGKAKSVNSRNIHAFKFIGVPKQPCHDLMPHPNIWDSRGDISRTAPVGICTFTLLRVVDLWAPFAFFLGLIYTHHGGTTERTRVKCGIATKGEDRNSRKKKKNPDGFWG